MARLTCACTRAERKRLEDLERQAKEAAERRRQEELRREAEAAARRKRVGEALTAAELAVLTPAELALREEVRARLRVCERENCVCAGFCGMFVVAVFVSRCVCVFCASAFAHSWSISVPPLGQWPLYAHVPQRWCLSVSVLVPPAPLTSLARVQEAKLQAELEALRVNNEKEQVRSRPAALCSQLSSLCIALRCERGSRDSGGD